MLLCLLPALSLAAIDTYEFARDQDRQRFRNLTEELRCPKCQNQNIADSDAPIAMDLRREIHRMLDEGRSDEQIVDYLVSRYGDFVRYRPLLTAKTLLLWYGPWAALAVGLLIVGGMVWRRRQSPTAEAGLSAEEQERLTRLLQKERRDDD